MMKTVLLKSIMLYGVCLFIKGYGQVIELKIDKKSERGLNGIRDESLFGVIYPVDILNECESKKIPKESLFKDVAYIGNPITLKEDDNPILMFYQMK